MFIIDQSVDILLFLVVISEGRLFKKLKISEENWNSFQTHTVPAQHMIECSLHCRDHCGLFRFDEHSSTCHLATLFGYFDGEDYDRGDVEVFATEFYCPEGWVYYEWTKSCYRFFMIILNFNEANYHCKKLTGNKEHINKKI